MAAIEEAFREKYMNGSDNRMKEKSVGEYLSLSATYLHTAWRHEQLQMSKPNEKLGKRNCPALDID